MARSRTHLLPALRPATIAGALIALLALVGCESGTEEPEAPEAGAVEFGAAPTPAPADDPAEAASAPRAAGSDGIDPSRFPERMPDGAEAAIPANFPSSMPVYPNATPALGMSGVVDDSERSAVQLLSNDAIGDVTAFYDGNLADSGWEVTETKEMAGSVAITAKNGCATTVIMLQPSPAGGTDIYQVTEDGGC